MKIKCENERCGKYHDGSYGSGRFCSKSCARTRSVEIIKIAKKKRLKTYRKNPYIMKDAKKKEMETKRKNPQIMKDAGKKQSETRINNPQNGINAVKKKKKT